MFLEIASNNGTKYIRICETVRVQNQDSGHSAPKKKTIKNIGPVSRFDDGKPDFINRLKASYAAGNPILDVLKPYVNSKVPQEVYNIRLCEGTNDCVAHPKLISNLLLEKILETLDVALLIRSYKNHYGVNYDVYGFFKLLLFGRILHPASKWATVKQNANYAIPMLKEDIQEFNVYKSLDFIYEHRRAIMNRINSVMVKQYSRTTANIFYDVTNFFFETDEPDEDESESGESMELGLRQMGVSKENRKQPIVQMGLLMDNQGIPISIECFPGNTLDHQTLATSFRNSVDTVSTPDNRFIFVCDKGIGKGESIVYAISNGLGYLTSRTVRGASKEEKAWIADPDGYTVVSENFRYKTRIVKKQTVTPEGVKLDYSEKVLTYWSKKYYDREVIERKEFFEFAKKYLENPKSFRLDAAQTSLAKKYLKKEAVHKKTGELLKISDLSAMIDEAKLKRDYNLLGYYTLATSEINMDNLAIINTYGNLVEIEDQFRIMKSTLDARPLFVRTKEHIIAHLTLCTIALIAIRLIQKKVNAMHPELKKNDLQFSNILSADRIQNALNQWMIESVGDVYYRFCNIDNPDLALILNSFGIDIPKKCYRISEVKQLKTKMEMSM